MCPVLIGCLVVGRGTKLEVAVVFVALAACLTRFAVVAVYVASGGGPPPASDGGPTRGMARLRLHPFRHMTPKP